MPLPPPRTRPKFAQWRYDRNLSLRATADLLAEVAGVRVCSHETIRVICLPFGHPGRMEPEPPVLAAIVQLTAQEITGADFSEPRDVRIVA